MLVECRLYTGLLSHSPLTVQYSRGPQMMGTIVTEPAMRVVKAYMFSYKYVGMLVKVILALVHIRFVFTLFMCGIEIP